MTNHIQISVEAREDRQEVLISELSDMGANGFEQTETHLLVYFNEADFPSYEVNSLLNGYNVQVQTLKHQNWNELWESNFQPVIVDDFCAVRAHFHAPVAEVAHEIIITPKMSFGTGHHATTWMMLQQMRDMDFGHKKVFDFGAGTAILSIMAEKLGAASVTAIDNDEWSIENGHENIAQNGCSRIHLSLASSVPEDQFDIVLANINRNVILMHLPYISAALAAHGTVLFSGLLMTDKVDIVHACNAHGLQVLKENTRDNWLSLLVVRA
jgi:ribosomal protein L11 methyltransferase